MKDMRSLRSRRLCCLFLAAAFCLGASFTFSTGANRGPGRRQRQGVAAQVEAGRQRPGQFEGEASGAPWDLVRSVQGAFCLSLALLGGLTSFPAFAESKRVVGEIPASGFIFKDTINVEAFEDPKVTGVTLYISDFSRSMADRVSKGDFFSDPGAAGLTCAKSGPVKIAADVKANKEGEDVFTEARSLLFKTLKVKRIYDAEAKNILYVVFTERLDTKDDNNKSRYKSQVCALHVDGVQDK
ncbi:unnamed protein product [Cladocopium goreaui]|uniref:Protein CreA (Catabolite regulation protein A) n=1 Tax=Cladocopium goreaui TaxID=2562237 RepID=A0A9P1BXV7_9DINO|nr:unnamed protein product [Cladocopium goreaui]|mmetsp:Transcript_60227/g.131928  ORF Transcript_60227/g.131928 Transcript_60227/m.131928 type:complete len:241 (-) Transcript_60227:74-796(-)